MSGEKFNSVIGQSQRVYDLLLKEFRSRFDWFKLSDDDIDPDVVGLGTVLMDHYINDLVINRLSEASGSSDAIKQFFGFIEELELSEDNALIDAIDTTLLEVLACEERIKLETLLPYCGTNTRRAIYDSVRSFYGKSERARELELKFPC